jgi:two-component system, NtrC family, sensor kinase
MIDWIKTAGTMFTPELAKASLVLALISVSVVGALFAFVGRRTQRPSYSLWAVGWMFYAAFLASQIAGGFVSRDAQLVAIPSGCVALAAWFMFCGNLAWLSRPARDNDIAIVSTVIAGFSYFVHSMNVALWYMPVGCCALAAVGVQTAILNYRDRQTRASRLFVTGGFLLWTVPVVAFPLVEYSVAGLALTGAAVGAFALAIVVGVIIAHEVASTEQKYRSVLDGMNEAVFIVDLWTSKIVDANQVASRLARRDPSELVGSNFLDMCPDLRQEGISRLDQRKMFATVFKPFNEFHFVRADGSTVMCEGDTSLAQWHQRPVLQVRVREITEDKGVGPLMRRFEKMSSLGQLIAGVAHELNNPLAVVVGYAQLLTKHRIADPIVSNNIQHILHETERAAKIVRDLLVFARPCEPQMTVVDLNKVVGSVCDIRERDLKQNAVELRQHLQPGLCLTKADTVQLEQVLNNLITNALHAMSNRPNSRVLTVTTAQNSHFIRLSISDTGCGIAPDVMAKMFDPFFTTKPVGKGTGLGLSISRTILEEHHGSIRAESEAGKGATFHLEIPIVACEEAVPAPAVPASTESPNTDKHGHRLLVVDDEPGIREVLEAILVGQGYLVTTATNGVEAVDRLKREHYDLIISDMCMPEMDGEGLYETVHGKNPRLAERMLFVTGDVVSARSRTFLERTGSRWLTKPFNIRDVEELVAGSLRHAAIGPAAGQGPMLN